MAIVMYDVDKKNNSLTDCPYNKPVKVCSHECVMCKYFSGGGTNNFEKYINCNYAEDVASRNRKPKKQKSDKVLNPVKFKCICGHNQYTCLWSNSINPRTRAETVRCNKCKLEYKLEFTLTNQIVPYKKRK